jgi:uncharacterized protein YqeY
VGTSLQQEIRTALDRARRDRDKLRTVVLTSALSEIRNREIELQKPADDEVVREVLARGMKQRKDAAEQMRAGGREELALKEESESGILAEFLPPQLDEDAVRALIRDIVAGGAVGIGPVMAKLAPQIKGRFDGKEANRIVREEIQS